MAPVQQFEITQRSVTYTETVLMKFFTKMTQNGNRTRNGDDKSVMISSQKSLSII
jgi:hypothetical protein